MKAKKRLTLCPACEACPEVAIYDGELHIGEAGNLVRLSRSEWNSPVEKIKKGELDVIPE
ncbi:MAG TPA: hypothetical protein ACFYD3_06740 [Candidatus Hypogeohydataceae bacterium YC41]